MPARGERVDALECTLREISASLISLGRTEGRVDRAEPWFGHSAASPRAIAELEARLGVRLPPSYRAFLELTNGWDLVDSLFGRLLAAADVRWFREEHLEWIEAFVSTVPEEQDDSEEDHRLSQAEKNEPKFRRRYMYDLLLISEPYDGGVFLLNPKVVDEEGEWEAWAFANWYPGARRHRSFAALLDDLRESLRRDMRVERMPVDPDGIVKRALPELRAWQQKGFGIKDAVIQYLIHAAGIDEEVLAWMHRAGRDVVENALRAALLAALASGRRE
jgi:hypothetical protein